nr:Chain P, Epidermal growth factor receptor substrate 15 [synthetic construct]1KYU_P Chain P, EPIDERMAL GROWTH FACTOR RECEPTOR SUBSTRATE 15 [synthetic construct]
GSDPFK